MRLYKFDSVVNKSTEIVLSWVEMSMQLKYISLRFCLFKSNLTLSFSYFHIRDTLCSRTLKYYIHSDVRNMFKSSTTLFVATRCERISIN